MSSSTHLSATRTAACHVAVYQTNRPLTEYPGLQREDILACIAYGSEMARQRFVDWEERSRVV
jgi:hypothetical protein